MSVASRNFHKVDNSNSNRSAIATFKSASIDLVAAFCDAEPRLWRKIGVRSSPRKRRVKHVTTRIEGIASLVCFHEKHGDPPRVEKRKSSIRGGRASAGFGRRTTATS
jgi:hypothetical protein